MGRSVFDLVPADKMDEMRELFHRVKEGETVHEFETERVRKDGVRIHMSISMSPVADASGTVTVQIRYADSTTGDTQALSFTVGAV